MTPAETGPGLRLCRLAALLLTLLLQAQAPTLAQAPPPPSPGIDWVPIARTGSGYDIARTETTVGQFRRFVQATGLRTLAERRGGGQVYEAGWTQKPGWHWAAPFGRPAADDEPAVHLAFDEARAFCRWAGGRLPTDTEWADAAYLEQRAAPPTGYTRGRRYAFPLGDSPEGAQCLEDCGAAAEQRALGRGAKLWRGQGHARAGSTPAGVNGLHEMAGNAWEWVDDTPAAAGATAPGAERRTRGGSWWYGAGPLREDHRQTKPPDTTVVYIGFRCARGG